MFIIKILKIGDLKVRLLYMFSNKDLKNTHSIYHEYLFLDFLFYFILFLSDLGPCMLAGKVTTTTKTKCNLKWSGCAHI